MSDSETYDISIDPRTSGSAICVWLHGKVHSLHMLKTPEKASFEEKFIAQKRAFVEFLSELRGINNHIRYIAVEQFEGVHMKDFEFYKRGEETGKGKGLALQLKKDMMECAATRGMLIAEADNFCEEVLHPNKGKTTKEETELRCRAMGIKKSNQHTRDAVELGCCVGLDMQVPHKGNIYAVR